MVCIELLAKSGECLPMVWETKVRIPGRVIPKTQKMVFVATLLNTQHYKIWIKGKCSNPGIE